MGQFKHPNVIQLIGVVTVSKCASSLYSAYIHVLNVIVKFC